jgi:acetyl-CoA carboxylase biotin carboxyl carrier protein
MNPPPIDGYIQQAILGVAFIAAIILDRLRPMATRQPEGGGLMAKTAFASPLPGVFYRAPAADEPPFKSEGDAVAAGDTVGLIEVMKLFTPVLAEQAGRLIRFLVENEDAVMAGQALYELDC